VPKKPKTATTTRVQNLELRKIEPKTDNQSKVFVAWKKEDANLVLLGVPGSGKTFLALYLALQEAMITGKIVRIIRSAVPARDMGFMPGSLQEKAAMYEAPYVSICAQLLGRGDAYELLKKKGLIEFVTTSYLRGTTMDDSIIIVDEIQNNGAKEIHTIMTRIGVNSRVIFAGDIKQTDLVKKHDRSGLLDAVKVFKKMPEFSIIEFGVDDILRSDLVKRYIITRDALETSGDIEPV
jgi:phosphate starvation-inducible PhoH-like protein